MISDNRYDNLQINGTTTYMYDKLRSCDEAADDGPTLRFRRLAGPRKFVPKVRDLAPAALGPGRRRWPHTLALTSAESAEALALPLGVLPY